MGVAWFGHPRRVTVPVSVTCELAVEWSQRTLAPASFSIDPSLEEGRGSQSAFQCCVLFSQMRLRVLPSQGPRSRSLNCPPVGVI